MRIFMVDPSPEGGIAHYTYNLANAISKYEEITLCGPSKYELSDFPRDFELKGVFGSSLPLHMVGNIRSFLDTSTKRPDILHVQWLPYPHIDSTAMFMMKRFSRMPLCYTAHNILPHEPKKRDMHLYGRIYRESDCIIVHSSKDTGSLERMFGVDRERIRHIPHGNYIFLSEYFRPLDMAEARKELGIGEDTFVMLFFGLIRDYKGLDILLRSMAKALKERSEDILLIIAGKAPAGFSKYDALIKDFGIERNVMRHIRYIGLEELPKFFSPSDVVVLPYRKIYQSGVVQLSYAYRKPVIASASGGITEVVKDGRTGLIVKAGDEMSLKNAILTAYDSREKLKRMGENGWNMARTEYSWDRIARRTLDAYRDLV